LGLLVER
jgi:hypothetical protein